MIDTAGRPPGLRSVLANPGYRRLWAARTVSQCGDVAQFVTVALLVLRLTGSGLGVSGVVVAEIAPVLLLAPLAGPLVDRLSRVRVMITSDLARLLLVSVLVVWHDNVVIVYAVAFGLSAGAVFFSPAANSLLPTLVNDDELVAANSGSSPPPCSVKSCLHLSPGSSRPPRASSGPSRSTPPATPSAPLRSAACEPESIPRR